MAMLINQKRIAKLLISGDIPSMVALRFWLSPSPLLFVFVCLFVCFFWFFVFDYS